MTATLVNRVRSTITPNDHPYMNGAWEPVYDEYDAYDLEVIGEIPNDLSGVYVRNTENPVHEPIGLYHPFDGDAMVHLMSFRDGKAEYRNRFVRTKGFLAEAEAGRSLWAGIAENPKKSERRGWGAHGGIKDSSSTDVVIHAGRILTSFYQCGEGYRIDPYTMEQEGPEGWVPIDGISAHPKTDERTGDLLFFNYSKHAPYMHYGVVGADNRLKHYVPIELPGPRLPHDMAYTKKYSIFADLPLFWDPEALKLGFHAARFYPETPTRFAIVPRFGGPEEIRWFEAEPTYVLHWMNAWEEGDEIVLDGYFQENPQPEPLKDAPPQYAQLMAYVDEHSFRPKLHRWRFDLKTGETKEERLDDRILEFGSFNTYRAGERTRYLYSTYTEPGRFLFKGVVKHDDDTGASETLDFGEARYGSEAPFAPRVGARDEDDGYLVSFVTDMAENRSECVVINAQNISGGPVCRIILPHRIPSGTHATWATHEQIDAGRAASAA